MTDQPESSTRFTIAGPRVIAETIDRETLVIHLGTGFYYVLRGSASDIWNIIAVGTSLQELYDLTVSHKSRLDTVVEVC